jgi:transglutaminase-like putative cysteine protease
VIYDIKLRIGYEYANSAVGGRHVVCVMPLDRAAGQTVQSSALQIEPTPEARIDRRDFFGNQVTEFSFRGPHDGVRLMLQARVRRDPSISNTASVPSFRLVDLHQALTGSCDMGPHSPLHFLASSSRVPRDVAMTAFAVAQLVPDMTVAEAVEAIGRALFKHMRFDPNATTVDTLAAEAFAKGRGVCQDFSHIMISALRGIGVPAGYVSGFLRTLPPPGKARLEGADAMHAWVRAWCGDMVDRV